MDKASSQQPDPLLDRPDLNRWVYRIVSNDLMKRVRVPDSLREWPITFWEHYRRVNVDAGGRTEAGNFPIVRERYFLALLMISRDDAVRGLPIRTVVLEHPDGTPYENLLPIIRRFLGFSKRRKLQRFVKLERKWIGNVFGMEDPEWVYPFNRGNFIFLPQKRPH